MIEQRDQLSHLAELAKLVRWHVLRSTTAAGSGHPTSCLSAVELTVALLFGNIFRVDLNRPQYPNNDRLIFSKGHAAPLLYALYAVAGRVKPSELLLLRKFGNRLEGHPMPTFPYTEFPTGSLGQGLSVGVGMALAAKLDRLPYRTYVLLGDSEMTEGAVWEAIQFAAFRQLDNLTAVVDVNRLGQSGPTMLGHDVREHAKRIAGFGWKTIVVDGHNLAAIHQAYHQALAVKGRPTAIVAKTIKGKGVSFLENRPGWHGRALTRQELKRALPELGRIIPTAAAVLPPLKKAPLTLRPTAAKPLKYKVGDVIAPRRAFGNALVRLARTYPQLIVLDGEVKNSTHTEDFAKKFPRRFVETFVAEQNMIGVSSGLATRGKLPVASTFAAFFTRAFDQLRMAQYSGTHQVFVGSHAGVSIGMDGASQMGLEDIALFRSLQNSTVLYPADALAMEKLLEHAFKTSGIVYLRATRGATPVLYKPTTRFPIGGSHVLRRSAADRATVVAAGITLHEALKSADTLVKQKIPVRVIDLYSIKPIDAKTLKQAARETKHIITVEDHYPAGGLADAVRSALGPLAGTVISLAVTKIPRSGRPDQLLQYEGIDAAGIVQTVKRLVKS